MSKQTFVVTLEVLPPFDRYFPKVEAERVAVILCEGVEAKSCSFLGEVPFTVYVERTEDTASASGKMREYTPEDFKEVEALQEHLSGSLAR